MYVFKATYFNTKSEKEEEKFIDFIDDLYGLETELECYEYALNKAYSFKSAEETLIGIELIAKEGGK